MRRSVFVAAVALAAAGCAARRPLCHPSVAGGEAFCAITCPGAVHRAEPCPDELPARAEAPGAVVCRAEGAASPIPEAICAQLPAGCEAPPTTADGLDEAAIARLAGAAMEPRLCADGHEVVLTRDGPREPTADELEATLEARRAALAGIEGVAGSGLGVCCTTEPHDGGLCIRLVANRRELSVPDLAEALAELFAGEREVRLRFLVSPVGLLGPRCAAESPFCGPLPYEGECLEATPYRHAAPRRPNALGASGGECSHDGECSISGCGNGCHRWTVAHGAGTCEGYTLQEPVYCGCVAGACSWFTQ